jgi:hypothetical protein
VTVAEGEALAKKMQAAFVESSAKDNKNVGEYDSLLMALPLTFPVRIDTDYFTL